MKLAIILGALIGVAIPSLARDIILMQGGDARCAVVVSARVMATDDIKAARRGQPTREAELQRRRLRASVRDLVKYLALLNETAAMPPIVQAPDMVAEGMTPIRVGEIAASRYGPVGQKAPYRQAFRMVANNDGIGLYGESDLATSYAIYTLLDQLGCRWYMPGPHGAVIPHHSTVAVPEFDKSMAPYTHYRNLTDVDEAYRRRNRLGGLQLYAAHALEYYISAEDRQKHPEWVATVGGNPSRNRLKWSAKGLEAAIAAAISARFKKEPYLASASLSPADGLGFDDSAEDRALDAGDFDPSLQTVSITDRLVWLCNRIVAHLEPEYPDALFGMLAYVNYTRPPKREKLHPNIVPQIAPITYSRAHPITDSQEPNNTRLQALIRGWGEAAKMTSIYYYGWFLAEPSAPNPFITKWSINIPYVYRHGSCRFWQPETTRNFETTTQALYLGIRMAWDPDQKPADIIDRLHRDFYGNAAGAMTDYWHYIDHLWVNTPEYSGCGFGHLRRFTPERLRTARRLLDEARAAARTPAEQYRIQLADASLRQFELFMDLRRDLAEGRFAGLDIRARLWQAKLLELSEQYRDNYCFGRLRPHEPKSLYGRYFKEFYQHTYDDAARLAREHDLLTSTLRDWEFQPDLDGRGPLAAPAAQAWQPIDVSIDTWSAKGMHNHMGGAWYRRRVTLPAVGSGEVHLWIGATDGSVRVEVNGQHIPYTKDKDIATGYCRPFSFNITAAVRGGDNEIVLYCKRVAVNELGTGGLLAAPVIYHSLKTAHSPGAETN